MNIDFDSGFDFENNEMQIIKDFMSRKEEKTIKIYEAALNVFARYGYKRTRVEDIADELGMTKGSLYLYVKSKKDLYHKTVSYGLRKWQAEVAGAIERVPDIEQKFRVLCETSYDYLAQDQALRRILIDDPGIFTISSDEDRFRDINQASVSMLREVLANGIAQQRFREADVDHLAELLYSIYVMFIIKTYVKSDGKSTRIMFKQAVDIILNGILTA